jgi:L-ascorbate metabolism protein UlaG (beta-lactamase superfamily)
MIEKISWLGHASFRIDGPPRIYIDPWRIPDDNPSADVILISHEHYDHFSTYDIDRLLRPDTHIITNQSTANLLSDDYPVTILRPWQSINIGRANIKAVPAYTYDEYHPALRGDLGFIIALNYYDIFYAGDSDFIPEHRNLRCDIAILPVSAKEGLMTIEDTVDLVKVMQPSFVIPSHYGSPEGGTRLDATALETAIDGLTRVAWLDARV